MCTHTTYKPGTRLPIQGWEGVGREEREGKGGRRERGREEREEEGGRRERREGVSREGGKRGEEGKEGEEGGRE